MVLGTDHTPNIFREIAEKRMEAFVAGIGPAGAPSRLRAAEAVAQCSSILDVGCGPGVFLATLQLHFSSTRPWWRYVGVDAVQEMLPLGVARDAEFMEARAESLPFADGEFEAVVVRHLLEHLEDPYPAIREAARVCSKVLVLIFSQWPRNGGKSIMTDAHLKAVRWSHPAPLLEAELRGAGMGPTERENYSPNRKGRLAVREAIWVCAPRGLWVDQVTAALGPGPAG